MLVRIKVNDNVWIEETVDKEVDAFKALSRITEVFQFNHCGACNKKNIKFVCRKDKDDNDWLEIVCQDCRAKLIFGQTKGKGGEIYPKTRWNNLSETQQQQRAEEKDYADKHYGYLPNGGWFHYKGNYQEESKEE